MYSRRDPRWNRTIQHIGDTLEHANESTQEHLWTFTHDYVNPCFASITQCVNACTAPCFPSRDDRRRNRGRSRGRAELSFDFYDDWEEDENDGLLGWGSDNLDRLIGGGSSNYGAVSQPGRQRTMSYGNRNRDPRFNSSRRKSAVGPHDGGPDPTIIPSSSYFGFLGRLPFKVGGKGLRYKPSAADLVEHPGQGRRSIEEGQPLIEDSDEEAQPGGERKVHRRQRSHTDASGHTTDSLSSRGDIFPSEDELDDAVPLDDEFTMALERRTTGQWTDDASSGNRSKKPSVSRGSTRTASSRNTQDSGRKSMDNAQSKLSTSVVLDVEETQSLSDLKEEEERLRLEEEREIDRKRRDAQQLALQRGLVSPSDQRSPSGLQEPPRLDDYSFPSPLTQVPPTQEILSPGPTTSLPTDSTPQKPHYESQPEPEPELDPMSNSRFEEPPQTAPDSSSFHVDESDFSSFAPTPNRPLSLRNEPREVSTADEGFIPAMLPHFSTQPG